MWLEYDEEDFIRDPNYISKDDDFLNINDEEVEEWTKFGILRYFDFKRIWLLYQLNVILSVN